MAGIDGQIFRSTPPPHELVHHARHDGAVVTKEGLVIDIPPLDDSRRR